MAVNRGDTYVQPSNTEEHSTTTQGKLNSVSKKTVLTDETFSVNTEHEHLINSNTNEFEHPASTETGIGIFESPELYTGFQKITTIPAAAFSIVAGFIMIASVSP